MAKQTNSAVHQVVRRDVDFVVYRSVDRAVDWDVDWDVGRAVGRAVENAVYRAVENDTNHPGLQDFLVNAKVEA
jgi:hypothetical protein